MRSVTRNNGFGMIELIIGIGIVALLTTMMWKQVVATNDEIRARNAVEEAAIFLHAAKNYFAANRTAILAATIDGAGADKVCVVNFDSATETGEVLYDDTLHTCTTDVTFIRHQGYLPESFRTLNSHDQQWTAIYRRRYDSEGNPTPHAEMLVVAASAVGSKTHASESLSVTRTSLNKAMLAQGGDLGAVGPSVISEECNWSETDPDKRYICGSSAAWRVKASDFLTQQ